MSFVELLNVRRREMLESLAKSLEERCFTPSPGYVPPVVQKRKMPIRLRDWMSRKVWSVRLWLAEKLAGDEWPEQEDW